MDPKHFKEYCERAKKDGAIDFSRKSHYEPQSPLVEAYAEVLEVRKSDFHILAKNVYYPRKETSDAIGKAAGLSFRGETRIQKLADGAWIGTASVQELGPDGKMITWASTSYEFNPNDRAIEDDLRDQVNGKKASSELELKLRILENRRYALRRADTGARVASIISAIGMPTGFKDLFQSTDKPTSTRTFLFSRIIVNAKNELVLSRALDSMFGAVTSIAGPAENMLSLMAPSTNKGDPDQIAYAEKVRPDIEGLAQDALANGGVDDEGFRDNEGFVDVEDRERKTAILKLEEYISSGLLTGRKLEQVNAAINNGNVPLESLKYYVAACKGLESSRVTSE